MYIYREREREIYVQMHVLRAHVHWHRDENTGCVNQNRMVYLQALNDRISCVFLMEDKRLSTQS